MSKFIPPFITVTEIEWVDLQGEREVTVRTDCIDTIAPVLEIVYDNDGTAYNPQARIIIGGHAHAIYTKESAEEIREMIGRMSIEQRLWQLEEQVAHLQDHGIGKP